MPLRTFLLVVQLGTALILLTLLLLVGHRIREMNRVAEEPILFCGTVETGYDVRLPSDLDSAADPDRGKQLWNANACGSCHIKSMREHATGPALAGTIDRWAAHPREDLYKWMRNSAALIEAGHPRARELWEQWKPTKMPNFAHLSDADVEDLLAYIYAMHPDA